MATLRDRPLGILDEQVTEACSLALYLGADPYAVECFLQRWAVETWATDRVPAVNVSGVARA